MKAILTVIVLATISMFAYFEYSAAHEASEKNYVVGQEQEHQLRIQAYFHIHLLEEATASCEKVIGQPLKGLLILGSSNTKTNSLTPEVLRYRLDSYENPEKVIADIRWAIHEILQLEEAALLVKCKVSASLLAEEAMKNRTEPEVLKRLADREKEFFKTADNELAKARNLRFEEISQNRVAQILAIREEARK